jgi:hypothetical protein
LITIPFLPVRSIGKEQDTVKEKEKVIDRAEVKGTEGVV